MSTGADYDILSQDAVRHLHADFMKDLRTQLSTAIPPQIESYPGPVFQALMKLLIACKRKAIHIEATELNELACSGRKAIEKKFDEVEKRLHTKAQSPRFEPSPSLDTDQLSEINRTIPQRKEDPTVRRFFGDRKRIYMRLKGNQDANVSLTREWIESCLARKGYRIENYTEGYATDADGKQKFRIGKLLKENKDLRQRFIDDPARASLDTLLAVISRDPYDIAMMSTGRAWSSCMGSGGGSWWHVPQDIREGTLVAYLISKKDPEILNPLGRILIKPLREIPEEEIAGLTSIAQAAFVRPEDLHQVFVLDKAYGINNHYFSTAVERFIEENLNAGKTGTFTFLNALYQDEEAPYMQERKNGKVVRTSCIRPPL